MYINKLLFELIVATLITSVVAAKEATDCAVNVAAIGGSVISSAPISIDRSEASKRGIDVSRLEKYSKTKRILDVTLSTVSLPIVLPLVTALAFFVRITSKGPAFFIQDRVGKDGKVFRMFKLRTMTVMDNRATQVTKVQDSRVTWLGRWLRKSHLDELPQLLNVLRGDMSLVGPRPMALAVNEAFENLPGYRLRHLSTPGLTSPGQLEVGYVEDEEGMRRRLDHELRYLRTASLWTDLKTILKTIVLLPTGRGAR